MYFKLVWAKCIKIKDGRGHSLPPGIVRYFSGPNLLSTARTSEITVEQTDCHRITTMYHPAWSLSLKQPAEYIRRDYESKFIPENMPRFTLFSALKAVRLQTRLESMEINAFTESFHIVVLRLHVIYQRIPHIHNENGRALARGLRQISRRQRRSRMSGVWWKSCRR